MRRGRASQSRAGSHVGLESGAFLLARDVVVRFVRTGLGDGFSGVGATVHGQPRTAAFLRDLPNVPLKRSVSRPTNRCGRVQEPDDPLASYAA